MFHPKSSGFWSGPHQMIYSYVLTWSELIDNHDQFHESKDLRSHGTHSDCSWEQVTVSVVLQISKAQRSSLVFWSSSLLNHTGQLWRTQCFASEFNHITCVPCFWIPRLSSWKLQMVTLRVTLGNWKVRQLSALVQKLQKIQNQAFPGHTDREES